ncbi:MAG: hypothetical protein JXR51_05065 [Bacteroidales bacterium]|nr:hypothetical protein [Bacteroidales bacterium]MBN2756530.1 hypothetical protein [Bacteroidales bacterium]
MNITLQNYEAYILDLIEGNLSAIEKAELFTFLNNNTDLEYDLDSFEDFILRPDNKMFKNKNLLKKDKELNIFAISEIDRLSIAYLEKDITEKEQKSLDNLLNKRPEKIIDFNVIQNTKLKFDLNIKFLKKAQLKKRILLQKKVLLPFYEVAATIILFFGFSVLLKQNTENDFVSTKFVFIQKQIKIRKENATLKEKNNTKNVYFNQTADIEQIELDNLNFELEEQIVALEIKKAEKIIVETDINTDFFKNSGINEVAYIAENKNVTAEFVNDDISKRIQQLLDDNSKSESKKSSFAKIIGSIANIINRNFGFKKTKTDDNRKMIALKAVNFEYYRSKSENNKR